MAAADIYAECLLPLKEGYPLYQPELHFRLNDDVYETYRRKGISIGDIGIIRQGGDFDFLFNICRASSSNGSDAPNLSNVGGVEHTEFASSGSLGVSEQLRVAGVVEGSSTSGNDLARPPSLHEASETYEHMERPTPVGHCDAPIGFELIDAGKISIRPHYVSTDRPYLARGRKDRTVVDVEGSFNPIA